MKKIVLVLALFALATGVYAQAISLDLHASTFASRYFYLPGLGSVSTPSVAPSIGIVADMGNVDLLANVDFWLDIYNDKNYNDKTTYWILGIYAGVAPKLDMTERLTLTIPILAKFIHGGIKYKDKTYSDELKLGQNIFGLDLGGRAYYALGQRASVWMGFQVAVLEFWPEASIKVKSGGYSGSGKSGETDFYFFNGGTLDFGIKINF